MNPSNTHQKLALEMVSTHLNTAGPLQAEMLQGGYSGATLVKVISPDQVYVVRFLDRAAMSYHAQEIACQQIASDQGYGPKVYFADVAQGIVVMEYLETQKFPPEKLWLDEVIALLKKVHAGPSFPSSVKIFDFVKATLEALSQKKSTNLVHLGTIKLILETIQEAVSCFPQLVACHRDPTPNNLIYTQGKLFLIDYEAAGEDDPYIDLAQVALFNCGSKQDEDAFLSTYLERTPTLREAAKLSLMKQVARVFYGLECLNLLPQGMLEKQTEENYTRIPYAEILNKVFYQGKLDLSNTQNQMDFGLTLIEDVIYHYHSSAFQTEVELIQKGD